MKTMILIATVLLGAGAANAHVTGGVRIAGNVEITPTSAMSAGTSPLLTYVPDDATCVAKIEVAGSLRTVESSRRCGIGITPAADEKIVQEPTKLDCGAIRARAMVIAVPGHVGRIPCACAPVISIGPC